MNTLPVDNVLNQCPGTFFLSIYLFMFIIIFCPVWTKLLSGTLPKRRRDVGKSRIDVVFIKAI